MGVKEGTHLTFLGQNRNGTLPRSFAQLVEASKANTQTKSVSQVHWHGKSPEAYATVPISSFPALRTKLMIFRAL